MRIPSFFVWDATMKRLVGKKVWVIQFDDEDDTVLGWCEGFADGFIAIRGDHDDTPTLYVNLSNVREIELYRDPPESELRLLRFPGPGRDNDSSDDRPDDDGKR